MARFTDETEALVQTINRVHGQVGTPGLVPPPLPGVPEALPSRIARLAKEVTVAAELLAGVRSSHETATRLRHEHEARFAALSDQLVQAIHEHRAGTPEGVPEQQP